jgi:hypothetical protein
MMLTPRDTINEIRFTSVRAASFVAGLADTRVLDVTCLFLSLSLSRSLFHAQREEKKTILRRILMDPPYPPYAASSIFI